MYIIFYCRGIHDQLIFSINLFSYLIFYVMMEVTKHCSTFFFNFVKIIYPEVVFESLWFRGPYHIVFKTHNFFDISCYTKIHYTFSTCYDVI